MTIDDLNFQEAELIEILRFFKFLQQEQYSPKEISFGGRSRPAVFYHNMVKNRTLFVIGDESPIWTVGIQRRLPFVFKKNAVVFDVSDYYQYFDTNMQKGKEYSLKSHAEFIQKNLMPVIKGEVWIDDLIKHLKLARRQE